MANQRRAFNRALRDRPAVRQAQGEDCRGTASPPIPSDADWVAAQSWVAERFAELHAAILTKGAGYPDDTPEHNAIQARFLDEAFRLALLRVTSTDKIIAARTECLNYETYKLLGRNAGNQG